MPIERGQAVRIDYRVREVPCALPAEVVDGPDGRLLWCRRTGPVMRFQRRLDFRVGDVLTARVHRIDPPAPDGAPVPAVTRNLSANGVLLSTAGIAPGDVVLLELDLPGETVRAPARCLRVEDAGRDDGRPDVALSVDLSVAEEQRVREAVMRPQRRAIGRVRDERG